MIRRVFERRTRFEAPAEEVYRWHARPGALERLSSPWDPPVVESRTGGIEDEGARVVLRVGPLRQRWVAEHYAAVPGREFRDRQLVGPFALWEHTHRMIPEGPAACTLEDRIEYALPAGSAGDALGSRAVGALLDRMFAYRHRVTADDLAAHAACRGGRAMKVAITGSSGLVGSALAPFLTTGGHDVIRLVRRAPREKDEVRWDPAARTIDAAALEGIDAVVNLSGENIAGGRWSEARKTLLRSSRLEPTRFLAETLARLKKKPKVLVSVSAVGYYGNRGDAWLAVQDAPADDFLGRLSVEWETAAAPAARAGIRLVHPRIGIVLSPAGGALGRPTVAPAPAFALRLAFGEMADAALLASTRVRPARLEASGYRFRFPELEGALRHLLGREARVTTGRTCRSCSGPSPASR